MRALVIDITEQEIASAMVSMPAPTSPHPHWVEQAPDIWWQALQMALSKVLVHLNPADIKAVALDATSGTVLLADTAGRPLTPGLMYNDQRARDKLVSIRTVAPSDLPCVSASAGLAKFLWLLDQYKDQPVQYLLHQADWLAGQLCGDYRTSDTNNCLKSGYDPIARQWPAWLAQSGINTQQLPQVQLPGTAYQTLSPSIQDEYGFTKDTLMVTGTTDSTAALIATGAHEPGDAVTSLGSSLVLKIISEQPVFSSQQGIYSQPLGQYWLVGGASNSGGAVLKSFFSLDKMQQLQSRLQPDTPTGYQYYPLLQAGERFPINDPDKPACLEPRPADEVIFFQALLEGIAHIEKTGYTRLQQAGAPAPKTVYSIGGGASNQAWTQIRRQLLNVPMLAARHPHAAYGTALLAKQGYDAQLKQQQGTVV